MNRFELILLGLGLIGLSLLSRLAMEKYPVREAPPMPRPDASQHHSTEAG